jgi:arylformamidase
MKIIDISWPISNQMVTYKNKNDVQIKPIKEFLVDGVRESQISCGLHTGTHVDAPAHFLEAGLFVDQINLNSLIGKCYVFDLTHVIGKITKADLELLDFGSCQIALFKTKNSAWPNDGVFDANFIYLDQLAAQYLASQDLLAVGIDGLGIERDQPGHPTHKALLSIQIAIIEGLRLEHVLPGAYTLICLPIKIVGVDSAPARAVLICD